MKKTSFSSSDSFGRERRYLMSPPMQTMSGMHSFPLVTLRPSCSVSASAGGSAITFMPRRRQPAAMR